MPRRKKNAKRVYKPKNIRGKPKVIMLPLYKCQGDDISPGILRAVAEWRNTNAK